MNNREKPIEIIKTGSKLDIWFEKRLGSSLFSYKEIFYMFFPILIDQFFLQLMSVLTTSMISSSSQEAVAAVNLVTPIYSMISAIFNAISAGGTVIVAQYKGVGDREKTRRVAGQVMLMMAVVGVISCAVMVTFAKPLINLLYGSGQIDALVIKKACDYMVGLGISLICFSFYMGAFAVFRGTGASKVCLNMTVIINSVHFVGSIVFLNVLKLDIIGTALSFNLARVVGAVFAMFTLMSPMSELQVKLSDMVNPNKKMLGSVVKVGVPFAVEQLFTSGGLLIVQTFLAGFGTASIAANGIANSLLLIICAAGTSVMTMSVTIVGQCIGAGELNLARSYGRKMVVMTTVVNIISIAILMPLMPLMLGLFDAPNQTVGIIFSLLVIAVVAMPFFWSISNVIPGVLRAAGDATFASVVSLVVMWTVQIGLAWLLCFPLGLKVQGVWIATVAAWAVRSIVFWIRFRGKKWLSKKVLAE